LKEAVLSFEDLEIHLILDNYRTHKSQAVQRWLQSRKRQRFHLHFTPTSSSWPNQVERWFARITDRMTGWQNGIAIPNRSFGKRRQTLF
jgi:transposase